MKQALWHSSLEGSGELFSLAFPILFSLSCRREESKTHMWSPGWRQGEERESLQAGVGVRMLWFPGEPLQCHPAWNQQLTAINQSKEHRGPPRQILQHTEEENLGKMSKQSVNVRQRTGKQIMSPNRKVMYPKIPT